MKRKKDGMSQSQGFLHRQKELQWITALLSQHSLAPNLFICGAAESGKTALMRSLLYNIAAKFPKLSREVD